MMERTLVLIVALEMAGIGSKAVKPDRA